MDRRLAFYASQAALGAALVLLALDDGLRSGADGLQGEIVTRALLVGGLVLIAGNGYHLVRGNVQRLEISQPAFWLSVVGAVFAVLGAALALAF